jgi:serine/threonine protein kinase
LPFDERETQKLYQKIKECRYVLPQKLNDLEKDLIFRMLQKDPLNRITIQEIKQHKWFSNKISLYQIIDNKHYIYGNMKKVDEEIIKEMKSNEKINFEGLSDEEIKKAILNRDKKDFCTIYEFLEVKKKEKLDKERNETLKNDVNFFKRIEQSKEAETVLQKLKNKFQKLSTTTEGSSNNLNKNRDLWRVGVEVNKECFEITTEILEFLKNFGYEWKIVSNSYKIKCRKKRNDEELKLEKIKGELNVLIQIFNNKSNNNMNFGNNSSTYVLDLHKLSGKSMEFLEFCNDLISSLQKKNLIK